MAYLGKVKRQRNFRVAGYVVQLDPKGFLGIRRVGSRGGLKWFGLEQLCDDGVLDHSGQIVDPVMSQLTPAAGAVEVTL